MVPVCFLDSPAEVAVGGTGFGFLGSMLTVVFNFGDAHGCGCSDYVDLGGF